METKMQPHALSNTILLLGPKNGLLHYDIMRCAVLLQSSINVLSTIVKPLASHIQVCLYLNQGFPFLEYIKYIRFQFQKINSNLFVVVADEGEVVLRTSKRCHRGRPPQICVIVLAFLTLVLYHRTRNDSFLLLQNATLTYVQINLLQLW